MEVDPTFLKEYGGHESTHKPYEQLTAQDLEEMLLADEVKARLQAIEARSPKGTMFENSKYGKELFNSEKQIREYLDAVIPEGYIRNDTSSFKPLKEKRSPRETIRRWLNRMK
jgi:hypothetical protein